MADYKHLVKDEGKLFGITEDRLELVLSHETDMNYYKFYKIKGSDKYLYIETFEKMLISEEKLISVLLDFAFCGNKEALKVLEDLGKPIQPLPFKKEAKN